MCVGWIRNRPPVDKPGIGIVFLVMTYPKPARIHEINVEKGQPKGYVSDTERELWDDLRLATTKVTEDS